MFSLPYISDYLSMLLIMMAGGIIILFPTAYFAGKIGLFIAFGIITFITCFIFIYGLALGRGFSNSSAPISIDFELISSFISVAFLYLFISYGSFIITETIKGAQIYKLQIAIWFLILIAYPVYLYSAQCYGLYKTQIKNYETQITLAHPMSYPILIDQLVFFDSKSKSRSKDFYQFELNPNEFEDFEGLNETLDSYQSNAYYSLKQKILIPTNFDSFELSYYSYLEKRFYKDTFILNQEKLDIRQNYDGQMRINALLINILPDGNADLLKCKGSEVLHTLGYIKVAYEKLENTSLDSIVAKLSHQPTEYYFKQIGENYDSIYNSVYNKTDFNKLLDFKDLFAFGISVKTTENQEESLIIEDIKMVDFYLNQYSRSAKYFSEIIEKPLPSLIEVELNNKNDKTKWFKIAFDKNEIFDVFKKFKIENKEAVYLEIIFNTANLLESQIQVKSKDLAAPLSLWKISDR